MIKRNKKIENIRIRKVKEKDICQIYNINKLLFKEDRWSYEEFERLLNFKKDLYLILAGENLKADTTQICGFVIGKVVEGEVLKIGVDLPFQGKGIGRRLFESLVFKFRKIGERKDIMEKKMP